MSTPAKLGRILECVVTIDKGGEDVELKIGQEVVESLPAMATLSKRDLERSLLMFEGSFDVDIKKKKVIKIVPKLNADDLAAAQQLLNEIDGK